MITLKLSQVITIHLPIIKYPSQKMFKLCKLPFLARSHLLSGQSRYSFADENTQLKLPGGTENKKSDKPLKGN